MVENNASTRVRRAYGGFQEPAAGGRRGRCWSRREGPGPMVRLGHDLRLRLAECELGEEHRAHVQGCVEELRALVKCMGEGWELEPFGSMATGFGTRESDLDATCFNASSVEEEGDTSAATVLCERLGPVLRESPGFEVMEQVRNAKVPLLKLRFQGCLDIDLSCRNLEALQNTRLLRAYAQLDDRVRELGIVVKLWAKAARVCGASGGHLSCYTFTLMAIYFMQVHMRLPLLPTSAFKDGREESEGLARVEAARESWYCKMGLPELVCRFFWFYSFDFQWGSEVVCTRLGSRRCATEDYFQSLRGRLTSRIHIEDPYRLERNLHCVLGCSEEVKLRNAFLEAVQCLNNGRTPVGLRPEPSAQPSSDAPEAKRPAATPAGPADAACEGSECSTVAPSEDAGRGQSSDEEEKAGQALRRAGQGQWQWWQHMESASVVRAVQEGQAACACPRPRFLTVQELEDRIGLGKAGRTFMAKSTRVIAARVSKKCREKVRYQ